MRSVSNSNRVSPPLLIDLKIILHANMKKHNPTQNCVNIVLLKGMRTVCTYYFALHSQHRLAFLFETVYCKLLLKDARLVDVLLCVFEMTWLSFSLRNPNWVCDVNFTNFTNTKPTFITVFLVHFPKPIRGLRIKGRGGTLRKDMGGPGCELTGPGMFSAPKHGLHGKAFWSKTHG